MNTNDIRRRNSQKPSDEFYKNFKASFPNLSPGEIGTTAPAPGATSLAEALDISVNQRYVFAIRRLTSENRDKSIATPISADNYERMMANSLSRPIGPHPHDINKDADPTPRDSNETWNFGNSGLTPSMMDPNSHSFNMFANQMPGYYTPTPGGTSTLYHNQAGDLHTPGYGVGLGTPLSLPTSEGSLNAGHQVAAFHGFHAHLPQHLQQQPFQNVNPFHMHQQTAFPPHQFTHQPSFEQMEGPVGESPVDDMNMDMEMHHQSHSPHMLFHSQSLQNTMQPPPVHPSGEK